MKFKELSISGLFLIKAEPFYDERGVFRRHYCQNEFTTNGIKTGVLQGNISENPYLHTLRGFHYQIEPHAEGKTISCITGGLFDIVVDLRKNSKTYLEWVSVSLDSENRNSLYVPPGCANAYLTTESNTIVHYYMSKLYEPDSYRGFSYKDPTFDFKWPSKVKHISEKDKNLPNYSEST